MENSLDINNFLKIKELSTANYTFCKTYIVKKRKSKCFYHLIEYYLPFFKKKELISICARIKFLLKNWRCFRCSGVFFDHSNIKMKSVRPANVNFLFKKFYILEPLPCISLMDAIYQGIDDFSIYMDGFVSIAEQIQWFHCHHFEIGPITPYSICVDRNSLYLRPPPLFFSHLLR